MNIKKRDILKVGVELAVGAGVGIIANNAIELITPNNLGKLKKISVRVGGFALVWMVSSAAASHVNKVIDDLADGLQAGRSLAESNVARALKDAEDILLMEDSNDSSEDEKEDDEDGS